MGCTVGTDLGMKRIAKGQDKGLFSLLPELQIHMPPSTHRPLNRGLYAGMKTSIEIHPHSPPALTPNTPTSLTAQRSGYNQGSSKA